MNMHIMILMTLHAKYVAKNKWVIYYKLFVFLIKTDKGFDKATFENQMSVMRGQVRLLFYLFILYLICHLSSAAFFSTTKTNSYYTE